MALLENMDIDSLCSEDMPLPPTPPPPHHPPTITINSDTHPLSPEVRVTNARPQLQVPAFHMTVEEVDGNTSDDTEPNSVSASQLRVGGRSGEERPKSVLSIFKGNPFSIITRPLSSLSRRAKSALSNHSTKAFTLPSNIRVRALVRKFTSKVKSKQHADDSEDEFSDASSYVSNREGSVCSHTLKKKLDSLAGSEYGDSESEGEGGGAFRIRGKKRKWHFLCPKSVRNKMKVLKKKTCTCNYYIDPHGEVFFAWMAFVTIAYVYNAVAIPLRASFHVHSDRGIYAWLLCDYLCDLLYVLDIVAVQCHLSFRHNGVLKKELKVLAFQYVKKPYFWVDLLSLLPLDLLYLVPVLRFNSLLRLPRLLKVHSVKVFLDRFESMTTFPHIFRVAKLVSYFLYIIHIYTCVFYKVSEAEGFGINEWVYDGNGSSYLRCLYWGALTVATIHNLEERNPSTSIEYAVELFGYLLGVFILAVLIGEIRSIVEAANSTRLSTFRTWDRMKELIQQWRLPKELQDRVQSWHDYSLSQHRTLDENRVLDSLPKKMRADLAIHVHLGTLYKVSLFKDCEKTLLRELVLKLKPALFGPGDYICKKGEIGKEMYIVNQGQVQVVGGVENSEVLAELGPGSVFGEISLLAVGGGNRRTAHVRSKGFSNLFVLGKKDLYQTLVDYPDAQETLKKKARYLLRQDKKREHRRSQAPTTSPSSSQPPPSTSVTAHTTTAPRRRNHTIAAKAAVTAITTAARVARARAAASKLEEERERRGECSTQVEVHLDSFSSDEELGAGDGREREGGDGRTDAMAPATTRLGEVAAAEGVCVSGSEGPSYSSLWPSQREVLPPSSSSAGSSSSLLEKRSCSSEGVI